MHGYDPWSPGSHPGALPLSYTRSVGVLRGSLRTPQVPVLACRYPWKGGPLRSCLWRRGVGALNQPSTRIQRPVDRIRTCMRCAFVGRWALHCPTTGLPDSLTVSVGFRTRLTLRRDAGERTLWRGWDSNPRSLTYEDSEMAELLYPDKLPWVLWIYWLASSPRD
jgi:hypothetical protein